MRIYEESCVSPFLSSNILRRISDSSGEGMPKLDFLAERVPPAVWQYALAVVSVAVALGITDWLEPYTTLRTPLFYIAIISSAWFGGMGPGLLALVLSTLAVDYYFAPGGPTPVLSLRQPALPPPVLIIRPHRLLDKCSTEEGGGGAQASAR